MADVENVVLSILRNIQADIAGVKSDVAVVRSEMAQAASAADRLAEINEGLRHYVTYTNGLHSENHVGLGNLKLDVDLLKDRVSELERPVT